MQIPDYPFQLTDWQQIAPEIHQGITGTATWKILQLGPIRIRMVEYSARYLADHCCVESAHDRCLLRRYHRLDRASDRRRD